ncbi:hypothetical protein Q0812_11840 [Brevundimonas sp. 2R-24]|uniref:Methyl-accepting transducer domain-containing protein n=1 Tax=Peiella sedimenti TaxID=3061083 RepID=A0ABT8SQA3_9CAUL|nr:hypothetical protein [Caulobacteraceae bacterium XZ-24]
MTGSGISFVDRLTERGLIDRYGFLCFAFGGAALIILSKVIGVHAVVIALCAAAAILAYALLIQQTGTGRLRSDQAGDNCYYLGLVYTLASLAYAIFTFNPAETADTIISGFGVALLTTIVGLVLRVYFNQSRPDIAEAETSARLELAAASGKLKAELSRAVVSMNDFSRQTRQSLEELRAEMVDGIRSVADAAGTAVREVAGQATTAVTETSEATVSRSKKITTATDRVVSGIESHAAALAGLEEAQSRITTALNALESAAERSQVILRDLVEQSSGVGQLQAGAADTVREMAAAASRLGQHVEGLNESTVRLERVLAGKLSDIQAVPRAVADEAMAGIAGVLERLRGDLEAVVRSQAALVESLGEQVRAGAETAARHNSALEQEVARSRENVAKVHGALVEMTRELVEKVERRPE